MGLFEFLYTHYGYVGLVVVLVGGIVGLPLPDEIILTFVGYQVFLGKMTFPLAIVSALIGSIIGISLSYFLGKKLGLPFLKKCGPRIHISEARILKTQFLFQRFGPFLLIFGYFIPGVRHLTGYLAGISNLKFLKFGMYAYSGAFFWVLTFIILGQKLGHNWMVIEDYFHTYSFFLILLSCAIITLTFLFLFKKQLHKYFKKKTSVG